MLTAAKAGDMSAASEVLRRLWPPRRGRPLTTCPPVPADPAAAFSAILAGIQVGAITTDEGEALSRIVAARLQAVEVADLHARLVALEGSV
ncbi:hypothetical protein EAH89_09510 [Roseomonas nepalensis]|uniref:Uncharacterized protein n=1 Tax=Muricoccus nepalensis TaxID=1854500 RepID=A0A502G979_9PROT|nr:hypothetical protein EAH89_09510 [Roseomonas nepalensis]